MHKKNKNYNVCFFRVDVVTVEQNLTLWIWYIYSLISRQENTSNLFHICLNRI